MDDLWLTAINRARRHVRIVTPYFVPPPMAMRSLSMAIRRGVDVQVILPVESDIKPADYARRDYVMDLHKLGAKILRRPSRMVHSKVMIVDDMVAFAGSANFDMRSFFLNYELIVGIYDQHTIGRLTHWFERLSQTCLPGPGDDSLSRRTLGIISRMFAEEL